MEHGIPELLRRLDDKVSAMRPPTGFAGSIAIGVRHSDRYIFWVASFGASVECSFHAELPSVDATLLLDAESARRLATGSDVAVAPALLAYEGDRALLETFSDHYLAKGETQLALRCRT